ncbi:hypothetical protein ACIQZB_37825 [Streptomyces sp. NPDC097727]|uniref:hypothetical protein n=1 Tax=Streptomyces sp. NPDC097727 TaxID=3366092 RepID=UPI00380116E2
MDNPAAGGSPTAQGRASGSVTTNSSPAHRTTTSRTPSGPHRPAPARPHQLDQDRLDLGGGQGPGVLPVGLMLMVHVRSGSPEAMCGRNGL